MDVIAMWTCGLAQDAVESQPATGIKIEFDLVTIGEE